MASSILINGMFIYVTLVTTTPQEIQHDMLSAIVDTQHTFCMQSSYCFIYENKSINVSDLRELWHDQLAFNKTECCHSCSCKFYECAKTGTCCPEMHINYDGFSRSPSLQYIFCEPLQLKPRQVGDDIRTYPNTRESIYIIKKCPNDNYDDEFPRRKRDDLILMCENEDIDDIDTKIPVTYIPDKLTFRNKYCAECHGYTFNQLYSWNLHIACTNATFSVTELSGFMNLYTRILESNECNIIFSPQEHFPPLQGCELYISACNMSGKWKKYNRYIDTACASYISPYMSTYNNIFYYMCNADESDRSSCKAEYTYGNIGVTFSMLLSYDSFFDNEEYHIEYSQTSNHCPANAIFDKLQNLCLNISCMEPKIYMNNTCTNLAYAIGGVGYKVFIHLKQSFVSKYDITGRAIEEYFELWAEDIGLRRFINAFSVYFKISSESQEFTSEFGYYFEFYLPADDPQKVILIDSVYGLHETVIQIGIDGLVNIRLEHVNICYDSDSEICLTTLDTERSNRLTLLYTTSYDVDSSVYRGLQEDRLLFLLPTYNCPLITLDSQFYDIKHINSGVMIGAFSISLTKSEYIEHEGSFDIKVCRHTFDKVQEKASGGGTIYINKSYLGLLLYTISSWCKCLNVHIY